MELSELLKRGDFEVVLGGEEHTAPFSGRKCVWYDWIYIIGKGDSWDDGFTTMEAKDGSVVVQGDFPSLEIPVQWLNPYLEPSFEGPALVEEADVVVREYCLEPARSYHARVERFTFRLPPYRLFPFIARRRTTFLLALSEEPFLDKGPVCPLVPTFRGRTG